MTRTFYINGESLVQVKGCSASGIGSLSELGLTDGPISITVSPKYLNITVDAWGEAPPEVQFKLATAVVSMRLVHFDFDILQLCISESMGGTTGPGVMPRAGTLLGNASPRLSNTNHYIGVNITSPVANNPFRFLTCYLINHPDSFPLGTERSLVQLHWLAIPYTIDPWNNSLGAQGTVLWDFTPDT